MPKLTSDRLIELCRTNHLMSLAGKEEWEELFRSNASGKSLCELARYIHHHSVESAGTVGQILAGLIMAVGGKENV